jgi:predicted metalloprotease
MDSACGPQDKTAYDYCPGDDDIYLGEAEAWSLYSTDGDAAPAVGLAHESGHSLQQQMGVPDPTTNAETLVHEEQADCVAGAWIQYAMAQGWFQQADIGTTDKLLETIAEAETPDRTHGDLQERTQSMNLGVTGGLAACNEFYPATPVYPVSN